MNQPTVNKLVTNLKKAGLIRTVLPWVVEGQGEKTFNIRYVGLQLGEDWLEVFSPADNVMLKFKVDGKQGFLEIYLANKPPFVLIKTSPFTKSSKWEGLLGNLKNQLKKDKEAAIHHQDTMGNLYVKLRPFLKNP